MYVYKISNTKNNFVYIGLTTREPTKRWKEHLYGAKKSNRRLYRAMRKHGIENFNFEVIAHLDNFKNNEVLFIIEKEYIRQNNSYWFGYNDTIGGHGFKNNRPKRGRKRTKPRTKGAKASFPII
jgi:group I intron endonuclease